MQLFLLLGGVVALVGLLFLRFLLAHTGLDRGCDVHVNVTRGFLRQKLLWRWRILEELLVILQPKGASSESQS